MAPVDLNDHALDAGVVAFLASVGSYASLRPDLHISSGRQLCDGISFCIRGYLSALPAEELVDQLRRHAHAEIGSKLHCVVGEDNLLLLAADRIAILEAELAKPDGLKLGQKSDLEFSS